MKIKLLVMISLVLLIQACQKDASLIQEPKNAVTFKTGDIIEGQYIVILKEDAVDQSHLRAAATYEGRVAVVTAEVNNILTESRVTDFELKNVYHSALKGFSVTASKTAIDKLKNSDKVARIEPDRYVVLAPPPGKGKPDKGDEDSPQQPTQETPYGITRVGGSVDATGKTVWILDTGVDLDHPDLNVDQLRSVTMISKGKDSKNADDGNGHGTHVAGTIAAINNNIGVVGVASNATVVAVKILDSRGSGSYSGVIAGINYVADQATAGDVANMSVGGPASEAVDDAVANAAAKGIYFAIAAGNDGADANNYSPARVNGSNIYTISAMDQNDVFAYFSNYSNPPVDFCAPGVSITSTYKDGGYATGSGTSMAAPHAAGVLLVTGGSPLSSGNVNNDPDGTADPIITH